MLMLNKIMHFIESIENQDGVSTFYSHWPVGEDMLGWMKLTNNSIIKHHFIQTNRDLSDGIKFISPVLIK